MEQSEETERMHRFEAAQRQRSDMRLVEKIEGYSTPRTTNFYSSEEEVDPKDFGLSDLEFYDFLKRCQSSGGEATIKSYYGEKSTNNNFAELLSDEERQQHQKLMKDASEFLELPVVIKDEEANYIGVWQKELEKEFDYQKLDIVPPSRVKLVIEDLHDLASKQIKKIEK